jgi:hypothetical protein
MKRLDALAKQQRIRRTGKVPIIDTTVLFTETHWEAFESGDAQTREQMRVEYGTAKRLLIDSYNVSKSEGGEIVAIVVGVSLPSESQLRDLE